MKTILAATPRRLAISALAWLLSGGAALAQAASPPGAGTQDARTASAELVAAFAPSGTLRVSINLGNPILATLDPHTHQPVGVSVDLAGELAKRLGMPLQLIAVTSAGASVENVEQDKAVVGFFAIDPRRGQIIEFTRPYVLIEGVYAVRNDSPITTNNQVDQPGTTLAVSKGSAYDLFLSRELHHASIVRLPTSPGILAQHIAVADLRLDLGRGDVAADGRGVSIPYHQHRLDLEVGQFVEHWLGENHVVDQRRVPRHPLMARALVEAGEHVYPTIVFRLPAPDVIGALIILADAFGTESRSDLAPRPGSRQCSGP